MTTEKKRKLVGIQTKLSYKKDFSKNLKSIMSIMDKFVYLGLSKLELNKIVMYEFWYDCIKLK